MLNGTPIGNSSRERWTLVQRLIWLKATVLAASGAIWQTVTDAIVSFNAPKAHLLKELMVSIEPVQSGSGDPSPDNVRPISGWTGVSVWDTGHNVWDETWEIGDIDASTGQNKNSTLRLRSKGYIPIKPSTEYYMVVDVSQTFLWCTIFYYDQSKAFIAAVSPNVNRSFTTPSGVYYMRFILPDNWGGATYEGGISFNYPSTDHDYHAYNGQQISVTFGATGHNQWDEDWEIGDINGDTGQNQYSSARLRSKGYIQIKPSTQYFFCVDNVITGITWVRICYYDAEKNFISTYSPNKNNVFTTPSNAFYMRFCTPDGWGGATYTGGIGVNYPSSFTSYEPYTNTMYGGEVDVVGEDGESRYGEVDLGSLDWVYDATNTRFYSYDFLPMKAQTENRRTKGWCTAYPVISDGRSAAAVPNNAAYFGYYQGLSDKVIYIKTTDYTSASDFKTAVNGVKLVYPLAAPIETTITPTPVNALQGLNNVWSDAGEVTVTFRGTPIEEPDAEPLQALNLLLGGAYRNDQTPEDVSDDEALEILLGGGDR